MENSHHTTKVIGAFVLGAALGAVMGILFAPAKGTETRRRILAKGEDLTDDIKEKLDLFLESVKNEVQTVKDRAGEFMDNGKQHHNA